jgi:hypothetical protein
MRQSLVVLMNRETPGLQILAEAGYSDADITELAAAGVTRLEGPRPVT